MRELPPGGTPSSDQAEVWKEVTRKLECLGASSRSQEWNQAYADYAAQPTAALIMLDRRRTPYLAVVGRSTLGRFHERRGLILEESQARAVHSRESCPATGRPPGASARFFPSACVIQALAESSHFLASASCP